MFLIRIYGLIKPCECLVKSLDTICENFVKLNLKVTEKLIWWGKIQYSITFMYDIFVTNCFLIRFPRRISNKTHNKHSGFLEKVLGHIVVCFHMSSMPLQRSQLLGWHSRKHHAGHLGNCLQFHSSNIQGYKEVNLFQWLAFWWELQGSPFTYVYIGNIIPCLDAQALRDCLSHGTWGRTYFLNCCLTLLSYSWYSWGGSSAKCMDENMQASSHLKGSIRVRIPAVMSRVSDTWSCESEFKVALEMPGRESRWTDRSQLWAWAKQAQKRVYVSYKISC